MATSMSLFNRFSFFLPADLDKNLDKPKVDDFPTDISPHLASPVGEGQILLCLIIRLIIRRLSVVRVTCISPTGENERGLKPEEKP